MQFYPFIIFSIKLKSCLLLSTIKVLKLSFFFSRIVVWLYSFAGNAPSESETKEEGGDLVKSCDKRRHLGRIRFRPYVRSWTGEARLARRLMTCIFALCAIFSWYDVNKALTEYTPKAYLTGEACLAHHVTPRRKIIAMRIEPRPMAVVSLISPMWNFGRKTIKKRAVPEGNARCIYDVVLQSQCYPKMRIAHFTGEARLAHTDLIIALLRLLLSSLYHFRQWGARGKDQK